MSKIFKIFIIISLSASIYYLFKEEMSFEIKMLVFIMFIIELFIFRVIKKDEIVRTLNSFRKKNEM